MTGSSPTTGADTPDHQRLRGRAGHRQSLGRRVVPSRHAIQLQSVLFVQALRLMVFLQVGCGSTPSVDPTIVPTAFTVNPPDGRVHVSDVRITEPLYRGMLPPGTSVPWPLPADARVVLYRMLCVSFTVDNATAKSIYLLDRQRGWIEGLDYDEPTHRGHLDWLLRDGPGPSERADCHGLGVSTFELRPVSAVRISYCDAGPYQHRLPSSERHWVPPPLLDARSAFIVSVGWSAEAVQNPCGCLGKCRIESGKLFTSTESARWTQ